MFYIKCFVFTKNSHQSEILYLFCSVKNALLCNYENEWGKLFDYYKERSCLKKDWKISGCKSNLCSTFL